MPNSPLLGYAELAEAQAIPATTVNLIDRYLEAMGGLATPVLDKDHTDPTTATTAEGTMYLVPSGATGAWTGWANSLVLMAGGTWRRILPREGLRAYLADENAEYQYDGAAWGTASGAFTAATTTEVLTGTNTTKGATPDSVAALWEQGSDVASAGTISLGEGGYFNITGTTTITDIDFATDKAGRKAWVKFAGALTLTHNSSTLILPTGASITTAAGDTACFVSEGSDAVRCVAYQRAAGTALAGGSTPTEPIIVACSDETTAITTGTAKATFRMPYAFTLTAVRASVTTAPTGSTIIIDINEGGSTILSTKLSIDASEKTSTTAASAAVISDSALADDAEITIDFDQVGSTVAGAGVKVYLIGHQ